MNEHRWTMILASVLALAACRGEIDASDIPKGATTGPLAVDLGGDATRDGGNDGMVADTVDEVWLRLDRVQVRHEQEGWIGIDDGRMDLDLMALRQGDGLDEVAWDSARIGEADVYVGAYDALRLSITDAWIVVEGVEHDLVIANGVDVDDAVDFDVGFYVDEDASTVLFVGFDLDTQLAGEGDTWTLGTDAQVTADLDAD